MKHEIEIPDLPEGYRAVAYETPESGDDLVLTRMGVMKAKCLSGGISERWLIVEKIKPRRRVFECVSETPRKAIRGEWRQNGEHDLTLCECDETTFEYKIWREVKEES